jgi:hypothetical protein
MSDSASDAPAERNGVPTDKMFGTIAKLKEDGDLAAFRFSARNEWVEGTASTSTIYEWYGAGSDQVHVEEFSYTADHPTLGHGHGPTPQEYVLHALAACITAGIATGAAARRVDLESVSSTVSADIDWPSSTSTRTASRERQRRSKPRTARVSSTSAST